MKKIFRALSVLMAVVIITAALPVTVSAGSITEAKEGVVYIESHFTASSDNEFIFWDNRISGYRYLSKGESAGWRGSGFAIGEQGGPVEYIVTNAHVVLDETADGLNSIDPLSAAVTYNSQRANEVLVYFSYGANEFMRAQIYMVDEAKDICILKLPQPTDKRAPLVICKSSDIDEDDNFAALGFPGASDALIEGTSITYDMNDITTTRGGISKKSTDEWGRNVYQIDIEISGGNSGGPLVNSNGEVVGINTYSVTTSSGVSQNYAIVIDELLSIINRDIVPYTLSSEVTGGDETPEETESEATTTTTAAPATEPPADDSPSTPASTQPPASDNTSGSGDNTMLIVIIAAAAAVVIAAVIVIIVVMKKKGSGGSGSTGSSYKPVSSSKGGAVITGMKGIMANRTFNINGSIVLGRNEQKCNVAFPMDSKGISGVHCQIRQVSGGYEIMDCGSSNGTFLGSGQKLTPNVPTFIPDGTFFYLGSAEQLFQIKY